jgi:hypothetical protein
MLKTEQARAEGEGEIVTTFIIVAYAVGYVAVIAALLIFARTIKTKEHTELGLKAKG